MKDHKMSVCKAAREDVVGGNTLDKILGCSWDDVNIVLVGWKTIMANYKKVGVELFLSFFSDHPLYKDLFPSFADVSDDDLPWNEDFRIHSFAVLKGINSIMRNLSGEYEEENEILPTIQQTHLERGITPAMMIHLKETLLLVCFDFLKSHRKERAAWSAVMDYIFREYLCRGYSVPVEDGGSEYGG